jgi:hypothetical protein
MARKQVTNALSLSVLVALLAGCVSPAPTPARLYNLDTGDVIQAQMGYSSEGHGNMTATLPTGETCSGEYAIGAFGKPYPLPTPYGDPKRLEEENAYPEEVPEDVSWAEVYGYGSGVHVQPVGSATLVGDRGTVLEIVIYSYYYYHGPHGDGVGRDNHGNWYRIYIGHYRPAGSSKS